MSERAPPWKQVVVRMPPELIAALRADAERNERSIASTVRRAVRRHLDNPERQ